MIEDDFTTVSRQNNSDETLTQNKNPNETHKSSESDFDSEATYEKAKGNSHFENWLGRTLGGRYLILSVLGKGGFGVVFRAADTKLNRPVVVKVLLESNLDNDGIIQRFKRESEALAQLGSHPGVVGIFDVGETTDEIPFIVIEYVEGKSLRHLMSNRTKDSAFSTNKINQVSFAQTAEIISQAAEALSFAHREGIIHRDIKPENIMLQTNDSGRERVRVIDFGIAKVVESLVEYKTETGFAPATLVYASPEQLTVKQELTGASDQFSLAVVAYEMLTGELPFQTRNILEMIGLHQEGVKNLPRTLRPDLPTEAETVLLRAFSYNPQNRFPTITDFSSSLKNALGEIDSVNFKSEIPVTEPVILPPTEDINFEADRSKQSNFADTKTDNFVPPIDDSQNFDRSPKSKKILPFVGIILLLVVGSALVYLFLNWQSAEEPKIVSTKSNSNISTETNSSDSASVAITDENREMRYWLEVQKMRGGRPFGEPFESSGREIFESGYKFRLNYLNENAGYFYLFNEGKDSSGKTNFNILYPIPVAGKESALTEKSKTVQTEWNTFGGTAATEKVWLIWTEDKTDVLEDAKSEAFNKYGKVADGKKEENLRKFIEENGKQKLDTEIEKDDLKKRTVISGNGDIIVHLIELEHR